MSATEPGAMLNAVQAVIEERKRILGNDAAEVGMIIVVVDECPRLTPELDALYRQARKNGVFVRPDSIPQCSMRGAW